MRGEDLARELAALDERDLLRVRRVVGGLQGPEIEIDGRRVLCFASNNYLGLASDPRLIRAAVAAVELSGASAGASPLISGHMTPHAALEGELADWLGCEAALVFGSGYHANIGTLGALVGPGDEIFSDALNHASLIDGCRLSRAAVRVYPHRDAGELSRLLRASTARRKLIVTDSIFSMDGDAAPLEELADLAERHDAWLMLDEAHAIGVFGADGAGLAAHLGIGHRVAIRMATLGKALGSYGAFVAGSKDLIDVLVNRARSYVFSTALPPAVLGAASAAVTIARGEPDRRARLWRNARRLWEGLAAEGLVVPDFTSPIVPLVAGEARAALEAARDALEGGVFAPAIRPPTVPPGTARLRLTPIATHDDGQIDRAIEVLARSMRRGTAGRRALSPRAGGLQADR